MREVPPGEGARCALVAAVEAAKQGDPLAPVTVVAAGHELVQALRQCLEDAAWAVGPPPARVDQGLDGGVERLVPGWLSGVRYATLPTLAERLASGSPRLAGRRSLSRAALLGLARTTLERVGGPLATVRAHPQTVASAARWYRVWRGLAEDGAELPGDPTARFAALEVVEAVRGLVERGWYDELDALEAAAEAVERGGSSREELGTIVVHLPVRLTEAEVRLLAALAGTGDLVVHLPSESNVGGAVDPAPGARALAALLGAAVPAPDGEARDWGSAGRDGERGAALPARPGHPARSLDGVVEAPDERAEARTAVGLVLWHLESGLEARRCAIAYPEGTGYASLLAEQLRRAGLAWNGPSPWRLGDAPVARLLLGAVALARTGPIAADALFDWLRAAPVAGPGGEPPPIGEWERCAAEVGVSVAEPAEWVARLAGLRAGRASSEAASSLAGFVGELGTRFADGRSAQGWPDLVAWALDLLDRYGLPEVAGGSVGEGVSDPFSGASRALREALRVLGELGEAVSARDAAGVGLDGFSAVLGLACEAPLGRHGRTGCGVTVAPLRVIAAGAYDLVVVVGLADDVLPGRLRPGSGGKGSAEAMAQRRDLLAALGAAQACWATWPAHRGTSPGPCTPSRWLADLVDPSRTREMRLSGTAAALCQLGREVRARAGGAVGHGAEPPDGAGPAPAGCLLDEGELLAALLVSAPAHAPDALLDVLVEEAGVVRTLACARQRDEGAFGAFAGDIGRVARGSAGTARGLPPDWSSSGLSPTALEALATCPRRYFFRHVLGAAETTVPGALASLPPPIWGQLVHEVLERFVAPVLSSEGGSTAGWGEDDRERLLALAREVFARYERRRPAGPRLFHRSLREDLEESLLRFLEADDARLRASGARPVAVEREFGPESGSPPVVVDLGGGRGRVLLCGRVDRVDALPGGGWEVVDYKTGRRPSLSAKPDDPLRGGRRVQLAVYGLAAQEWAASSAAHVRCRLAHVRADVAPARVLEEAEGVGADVACRLVEVLEALWDLAASGLFPPVPGGTTERHENCGGCDFDRLCETNRSGVWERAAAAPDGSALARFSELVRRGG